MQWGNRCIPVILNRDGKLWLELNPHKTWSTAPLLSVWPRCSVCFHPQPLNHLCLLKNHHFHQYLESPRGAELQKMINCLGTHCFVKMCLVTFLVRKWCISFINFFNTFKVPFYTSLINIDDVLNNFSLFRSK